MTDGLRYPSMRCILEYMEANKRIYLASRCPKLFLVEKSIPLRIRYILFKPNFLRINDLTYSLSESEVQYEPSLSEIKEHMAPYKMPPGDVQIGGDPVIKNFIDIRFKSESGVIRERQLPAHTEISVATKNLITVLLGGRKIIKVFDCLDLDFYKGDILRIPEGLKIWTRALNSNRRDFKNFLFLMDPSSFPLKILAARIADRKDFQHPVLCNANELVLQMIFADEDDGLRFLEVPPWIPELQKFPHNNVNIRGYGISIDNIKEIIRSWKDHGKEIGTCWTIGEHFYGPMVEAMKCLKKEFGGWYRKPAGDEAPAFPYYLSFPLNESSNLHISAVQCPAEPWNFLLQFKIKQIEVGKIEISKFFHYWHALHSEKILLSILIFLLVCFVYYLWVITVAPDFFAFPFIFSFLAFSYGICNVTNDL